MKKGIFLIPLAGVVATFVALGAVSSSTWSWSDTAGPNKRKINYCLLIGQTDHNDSAARTGGIREALKTRRDSSDPGYNAQNPNAETPVQGHIDLPIKAGNTIKFEVNEISSRVCVNYSGATWDQETAVTQCNTWYSKYKNNITMIISNNDGMAEGATFAINRPKDMPIFGYDSNASTLKLIKNGLITGTINSNAPAQALVMNILACRILDNIDTYASDPDTFKEKLFAGMYGVKYKNQAGEEVSSKVPSGDPYLEDGKWIQSFLGGSDPTSYGLEIKYDEDNRALLVGSDIVNAHNIDDYLELGTASAQLGKQPLKNATCGYNFYQCCYSMTDTYLQSTMVPLVKETRSKYGLVDSNIFYGNGNDENKIIDDINSKDAKQAYLINMVKTENGNKYIEAIKSKTGSNFEKTPIIFYNRQPTTKKGAVDPNVMKANPFTFYVGFDATAGAKQQGQMIVDWLTEEAAHNE